MCVDHRDNDVLVGVGAPPLYTTISEHVGTDTVVSWKSIFGHSTFKSLLKRWGGRCFVFFHLAMKGAPMSCLQQLNALKATKWTNSLDGQGKGEPSIHCLHMHLISQKSWEIGNHGVIYYIHTTVHVVTYTCRVIKFVWPIYLSLPRPHIFWTTIEFFQSFVLLHPPTGR